MNTAAMFYKGALSISHGYWDGEMVRYALNRISVPSYLSGPGFVEVLKTPADER